MVDSLNSLWHDTVICCDNKDCDICRTCSTHTHCCKRLMSRCVQECDFFSIYLYNRSTNVLCDTTSLSVDDICLTDSVQKGSLTVVNVTHDTDYRWTFFHLAFILFVLFKKFFNHINNFLFFTENIKLQCDFFSCLVINFLIDCYDFTLHEEFLYNNRRNNLHLICKFLNRQNLWNRDRFDLLFLFLLFLLRFLKLSLWLILALLTFSYAVFVMAEVFIFLLKVILTFSFVSLWLLTFHDWLWNCRTVLAVVTSVITSTIITSVITSALITVIASVISSVITSTIISSFVAVITISLRTVFFSFLLFFLLFQSLLLRGCSCFCLMHLLNLLTDSVRTWTNWLGWSFISYFFASILGFSIFISTV